MMREQQVAIQWILLGCGGHGRVLLGTLQGLGWMERLIGVLDPDPAALDLQHWQVPLLGNDGYLFTDLSRDVQLLNGLGSVGNTERRRSLYHTFRGEGVLFCDPLPPHGLDCRLR